MPDSAAGLPLRVRRDHRGQGRVDHPGAPRSWPGRWGASSSAALAVSAITPAFAAEYGPSPVVGRMPVSEALVTMLPPPALEQERAGGADAR